MRSTRRNVVIPAMIALLFGSACESATAPAIRSRRYVLSAVNGGAIPFDVGPAPPFGQRDSTQVCLLRVSEGALTFDSDRHTFTMGWRAVNSCSPDTWFITSSGEGTYERRGNAIDFTEFDGEKHVIAYRGTMSGNRIDVTGAPFALSFTR